MGETLQCKRTKKEGKKWKRGRGNPASSGPANSSLVAIGDYSAFKVGACLVLDSLVLWIREFPQLELHIQHALHFWMLACIVILLQVCLRQDDLILLKGQAEVRMVKFSFPLRPQLHSNGTQWCHLYDLSVPGWTWTQPQATQLLNIRQLWANGDVTC